MIWQPTPLATPVRTAPLHYRHLQITLRQKHILSAVQNIGHQAWKRDLNKASAYESAPVSNLQNQYNSIRSLHSGKRDSAALAGMPFPTFSLVTVTSTT